MFESPTEIKNCLSIFEVINSDTKKVDSPKTLFKSTITKLFKIKEHKLTRTNEGLYIDIPININKSDILTNFKTYGDFKSELLINNKSEPLYRFMNLFTSASLQTDFAFRLWYTENTPPNTTVGVVYDSLEFLNINHRFYIQRHDFQTLRHSYSNGVCINIKNL